MTLEVAERKGEVGGEEGLWVGRREVWMAGSVKAWQHAVLAVLSSVSLPLNDGNVPTNTLLRPQ